MSSPKPPIDAIELAENIKRWGKQLGFQQIGVAGIDLAEAEAHLLDWLAAGFHGEMDYMERHGTKRSRPPELVAGTGSVISARLDYLPEDRQAMARHLDEPQEAYISRYALGRDYHKLMRNRLQKLADRIAAQTAPFGYRVFSDSAPVLEKALAAKAGLGWIGKHSNLISREAGSWFFLGEIYTDLALPPDEPVPENCGTCTACLEVCPTRAIVAPYRVDARRCISYLTIELHGSIPEEFRSALGNRIYGCDDCQIVCPWNRFARLTGEADFLPRQGLDAAGLIELFAWNEATFRYRTEGSAIRRIGHERWLRNIALALGNAPADPSVLAALHSRENHPSDLVREHVAWALARQLSRPGKGLSLDPR
ncbi:MAG: tRNA epoxyqueuosine(34) reductase QueG [Methylococcaceae bacterium]|nr:tRNA epoxyqueuosine(34) reductase QueG [Methylococcaceae bacterium]